MLSKPIASGVMLTAIVFLGGGAWLQSDSAGDTAQTAVAAPQPEADAAPERAASAPNRVVDSAGFPVGPGVAAGPTVTVNGRPVNGEPAPAEPKPDAVAATPSAPTPTPAAAPSQAGAQEVAVIAPPRPIPRPEGLSVPRAQQGIDYDAIAAIAYGQDEAYVQPGAAPDTGEFMSSALRRALAPLADEGPYAPYDPRREGLVAVVGPDGEPIWIYEEQVRGNATSDSGVTFQTRQVGSHPYGFVYDDYGW